MYSEEVCRYAYKLYWYDSVTSGNKMCDYYGFLNNNFGDYYLRKSCIILREKKIEKILRNGNNKREK